MMLDSGEDPDEPIPWDHQRFKEQKMEELNQKNEEYQRIKNKYFDPADDDNIDEAFTDFPPKQPVSQISIGTRLRYSAKAFDPEFIRDDDFMSWNGNMYR